MRVAKRFICKRNTDGEECQGIVSAEGSVYVGIDAWRMLNRMDTCSYPVKKYESLPDALTGVKVIRMKTAYYMSKEKEVV